MNPVDKNWSNEEVDILLYVWEAHFDRVAKCFNNINVYKEINRSFHKLASNLNIYVPPRTYKETKIKISNMRSRYRSEVQKVKNGDISTWRYYDKIKAIAEPSTKSYKMVEGNVDERPVASTSRSSLPVSNSALNNQNVLFLTREEPLNNENKYPISDISNCKDDEDELSLKSTKSYFTFLDIYLKEVSVLLKDNHELSEASILSKWWEYVVPAMDEETFKETFRVKKFTFSCLCEVLKPYLFKVNMLLKSSVSVEKKVGISLYLLGSSNKPKTVAILFGVDVSDVNEIIREFFTLVNALLANEFLKYPTSVSDIKSSIQDFQTLWGFPQCMGVVDDFHIPYPYLESSFIRSNQVKGKKFRNVTVTAIVDAKYRFNSIQLTEKQLNTRNLSQYLNFNTDILHQLKLNLYGINIPPFLIGNSSYSLAKHLMSPYSEHDYMPNTHKVFNENLRNVRTASIEAFTRLKARFKICFMNNERFANILPDILQACCILHNICENLGDKIESTWLNELKEDNGSDTKKYKVIRKELIRGNLIRNAIAQYFTEVCHIQVQPNC